MTDKYIPASKLLAFPRWDKYKNLDPRGEFVNFADLRALIDEAPEEWSVADDNYQEGTAERLRLICSKLGIGAPTSNEEILLCQFSLLGSIRRKIDEIYKLPSTDLITLIAAIESDAHAASFQSMAQYRKWLLDLVKGVGK